MESIDRTQVEDLLDKFKVSFTELNQDKNEICIILKLSNGKTVLMKYNIHDKTKRYYSD